ncbi:thiol:disulfide interchange protein DsbG [Halomonas halocynthiae]|uniref:thiol:disulfide interchange protein DsbG n=1 Tax=Halomonas halocynthiae TaxID=176290 RepID=UPI0004092CAF|nr:thiol:disulfide interchange protein DsbG [Halomonas halocynthiae]
MTQHAQTGRTITLALGLSLGLTVSAGSTLAEEIPAPIAALEDEGLTVHGTFDAPSGLTGYATSMQGRELSVYLTSDGEHAIIGNMVDADGNNLSTEPLERLVSGPQNALDWQALEESAWIADGDDEAQRTVYTFTDPNCPFCSQFWQSARPWIDAGDVQLRHVMVGILQRDSPRMAISMLAADNPSQALNAHESGDPIEPLESLSREWEMELQKNHDLMKSFGLYATPSILYMEDGKLLSSQGAPAPDKLEEIMGSPAP